MAQHRTRLGDCDVMRHNPYNAVVSLGHANGTVSMWTPNVTTPVVKMLCHRVCFAHLISCSDNRSGTRKSSTAYFEVLHAKDGQGRSALHLCHYSAPDTESKLFPDDHLLEYI